MASSKSILTFFHASKEGITGVSGRAATDWIVIDDLTVGVLTARAYTWIPALLIDARRVLSAVGANHALWSTLWWTADVIRLTRTDCMVVNYAAVAVWTARRWLAWITW